MDEYDLPPDDLADIDEFLKEMKTSFTPKELQDICSSIRMLNAVFSSHCIRLICSCDDTHELQEQLLDDCLVNFAQKVMSFPLFVKKIQSLSPRFRGVFDVRATN